MKDKKNVQEQLFFDTLNPSIDLPHLPYLARTEILAPY
jgi:hypothetical protein